MVNDRRKAVSRNHQKNGKQEQQICGKGGWTQERKPRFPFGPRLNLDNYEMSNELMYYLHMLPVR